MGEGGRNGLVCGNCGGGRVHVMVKSIPFTLSSVVTVRSRGRTPGKQEEKLGGSLHTRAGVVVSAVHGTRRHSQS
eukprot:8660064-Ditylum_brightwellii.AAC.1